MNYNITEEQAQCLLESLRAINRLKAGRENAMLMVTWRGVDTLIRQALDYGGWRVYVADAETFLLCIEPKQVQQGLSYGQL